MFVLEPNCCASMEIHSDLEVHKIGFYVMMRSSIFLDRESLSMVASKKRLGSSSGEHFLHLPGASITVSPWTTYLWNSTIITIMS